MNRDEFRRSFAEAMDFKENRFHPLVWILGDPQIGQNVYIGGMSEINATASRIVIGDFCDIASFVSINAADSHRMCLGIASEVERREILIGDHVFIGTGSIVKGGARIGHHCVIAAGTVVEGVEIPPYSLVVGNPMAIKAGYYRERAGGR
ncbi:MAG TPA: acyltransferase [Candidatus Baltobacteraceae bacterium]|nr:acyltransferase [Candidatus Baltobacteraceae bacterium]